MPAFRQDLALRSAQLRLRITPRSRHLRQQPPRPATPLRLARVIPAGRQHRATSLTRRKAFLLYNLRQWQYNLDRLRECQTLQFQTDLNLASSVTMDRHEKRNADRRLLSFAVALHPKVWGSLVFPLRPFW